MIALLGTVAMFSAISHAVKPFRLAVDPVIPLASRRGEVEGVRGSTGPPGPSELSLPVYTAPLLKAFQCC